MREPECRQGYRSLLLAKIFLEFLSVKHFVDSDSEVSRQPPHIAAQASVQYFHYPFVFKYVGAKSRPNLLLSERKCVDQVSSICVFLLVVQCELYKAD